MTRFARHKKEKKPVGEDATPWQEMKEAPVDPKEKRREEKRLEKKRKRQLKKVFLFLFLSPPIDRAFPCLDLFSLSNTRSFYE